MKAKQTGKYYFDQLSEIEKEQFKENFGNCHFQHRNIDEYLTDKHSYFSHFIGNAFIWHETPEDSRYWYLISKHKA